MLHVLNGIYKGNGLSIDIVQADPAQDNTLNMNNIWFEVVITMFESPLESFKLFNFYLLNTSMTAASPFEIMNKPVCDSHVNRKEFFIGFELEPDYYYNIPTFGFYLEGWDSIKIIKLQI